MRPRLRGLRRAWTGARAAQARLERPVDDTRWRGAICEGPFTTKGRDAWRLKGVRSRSGSCVDEGVVSRRLTWSHVYTLASVGVAVACGHEPRRPRGHIHRPTARM